MPTAYTTPQALTPSQSAIKSARENTGKNDNPLAVKYFSAIIKRACLEAKRGPVQVFVHTSIMTNDKKYMSVLVVVDDLCQICYLKPNYVKEMCPFMYADYIS